MSKKEKKRMEAEIRAKRAFAEMRAKVGRYNLTMAEVAQVRKELGKT